jgi:hypothetical protein
MIPKLILEHNHCTIDHSNVLQAPPEQVPAFGTYLSLR